jgi:hypothetical protein
MTEISQELKENIFNLWFGTEFANFWSSSSPDYDLDHISELKFEIEPEDAKNINEVKSFTVEEEVMGSIRTTYMRKSNERSK